MVLVRSRPVLHHPFAPWLAPPAQLERTLVGREEILKNVCEKLEAMANGGSAKHVLLIGPRGMGKTHLVCFIYHYVSQRIAIRPDLPITSEKWTAVLFVEEEYAAHNTLANFLLSLCAKLHESDPEEEAWQLPETLPNQSDRIVTDCCFERIQEFAAKRGKKLLVLVDNMQKLLRQFPVEDHHRLRAFLMDQAAMFLVGTAPWLFHEIIDYKAPFFEFFETIYLPDLTEEEMLYLLETRFQEEGLEVEFQKRRENLRRKLPAIRRLTGGNPRLILFLYHIVTRSAFLEVESALRELIEELSDYFRSRYDALADQPRKVLDTLAQMQGPGTPTDIARAARLSVQKVNAQLKRLKAWGYVEPTKHGRGRATYYDITERLFRIWRQTATVAGCQRFKFLAQFLKIYYTPEEMVGIVRTYKNAILTGELVHTSEYCRNAVEALYYFQEAGSGPLRHEAFTLRMEAFIHLEEYRRAEEEAKHFQMVSVQSGDETGVVTAYKKQADVHVAASMYGEALKDIRQLLNMEQYQEALIIAETVLEKAPTIAEAWVLKGIVAANLGNHAKALESFQKATGLQPKKARYWRLQSRALDDLQRHDEALASVERAIALQPVEPRNWVRRGWAAARLGDHKKALESFQKATDLQTENAHYWHLQAMALGGLKRYAEALASAERAVELQPDDAHLWEWLGIAAGQSGDHIKALENSQKAIELDAYKARYWCLQAVALRGLKRFDEAMTSAEHAVELQPDDAWAWEQRGFSARELGDYTKALESFQKATVLQPESAGYWHFQAMAHGTLGHYAEALSCAERAVGLQPDDAHLWEWQGVAASDLGDYVKALESLRKAIELQPENADYWHRQATVLSNLGHHAQALDCIERAAVLQPDNSYHIIHKAWILGSLGKIEEALTSLSETLKRKTSEQAFFEARGGILLLSGRFKEAKKVLEQGLTVAPDAWKLLVEREVACACLREDGPNMDRLGTAILAIKIPSKAPLSIVCFLFDVATQCTIRDDLDRARCLLDVILSLPWQQGEWFGSLLGVFLGKLLDAPPSAFEMAVDKVKEKVVEPNILAMLDPYLQAAAYNQTDDTSILDRLFPEVRELVVEIAQRLRHRCTSPVENSGPQWR